MGDDGGGDKSHYDWLPDISIRSVAIDTFSVRTIETSKISWVILNAG